MLNTLISSALSASLIFTTISVGEVNVAGQAGQLVEQGQQVLASETIDLSDRYPVASVSEGFKENILIALGFLGTNIKLEPGEVFAFHNKGILSEFKQDKIITQPSDFTTDTGYKIVAGLGGNGVCHLASLMNKVAHEAGLEVTSPTNHNFATIPGIEPEYGTSISTRNSPERQNLYIRNSFDFPVELRFTLVSEFLAFSVLDVSGFN